MNKKNFTVAYRTVTALAIFAAIITQLKNSISAPGTFNVVNFFSFFTIESNIIIAVVFLVSGYFVLIERTSERLDFVRGASILFMITTGIIYFVLLRSVDVQVTTPWVNNILHYIVPIVALLDWLVNPPLQKISFKKALLWLTFPFLYFVYSLVRGSITHWYPYPFLNADTNTYAQIAVSSVAIAVGLVTLIGGLTLVRPQKS